MLKRYLSFSDYLKSLFGEKVYKISLDAGFTCPNHDGSLAVGGCFYCDEGSRAPGVNPQLSIAKQIEDGKRFLCRKYKAKKFLAYFQAYTNTYAPVDILRQRYEEAIQADVVGLSISTRPDCVNDENLDLIADLSQKTHTWLELGLQTIRDDVLKKINRYHTYEQFLTALEKTQVRKIRTCVHVIFGLPGETIEDMRRTAQAVAHLPIDGVKIHSLHVMRETPLERMYIHGAVSPLLEEDYVRLVCEFLELLPPHIVIHRLTGDAPPAKLLAPLWSANKTRVLTQIDQGLEKRNSFQGSKVGAILVPEKKQSVTIG